MVIYIYEHINDLHKKNKIELLSIILNSSIPDSAIQEKTGGTQFDITKCDDNLVERIYNFIVSIISQQTGEIVKEPPKSVFVKKGFKAKSK
jgi:hypothetical protein